MAISKTISNVTGGANLLSPQLNLTYIIAATVGIVVLLFVWKAGTTIYDKGSKAVQARVPGGETPDLAAALGII